MENENQNQNKNQGQTVLKKKRQRTTLKQHRLYTVYNLSEEEMKDPLYIGYIAVEPKKKGGSVLNARRSYLIEREKEYTKQGKIFPQWARQELNFVRAVKQKENRMFRLRPKGIACSQRGKEKHNKKSNENIARLRRDEGNLNAEDAAKLEKIRKSIANFNNNVREWSNLIAKGKGASLEDYKLKEVLTRIRGYIQRKGSKEPPRTYSGIKLTEELKMIATRKCVPAFREYLKQQDQLSKKGTDGIFEEQINIDLNEIHRNNHDHEDQSITLNEDEEEILNTSNNQGDNGHYENEQPRDGFDNQNEVEDDGLQEGEYNRNLTLNPFEQQTQNRNVQHQYHSVNLNDAYNNVFGPTHN